MTRIYTAPTGETFPLTEAKYDMGFKVYKSDKRRAIPGDPRSCLVALGIRRDPKVRDVFIGSGKDGYVIFKGVGKEQDHAVHFCVNASARRVVDGFDKDRTARTQTITLSRPSAARTLDARRVLDDRRRLAIKNGTHKVKHRGPNKGVRIAWLGVPNRPRPKVLKGGSVTMEQPTE
jgi:hypothetical protein